MTANSQWDYDCNNLQLPGGYVGNNPWFTQHSFLAYPVGPVWNCGGDCTAANPAQGCQFFTVLDVIFDVIGALLIGIGVYLLHKNHKNAIAWVMVVSGIALISLSFASLFGVVSLPV